MTALVQVATDLIGATVRFRKVGRPAYYGAPAPWETEVAGIVRAVWTEQPVLAPSQVMFLIATVDGQLWTRPAKHCQVVPHVSKPRDHRLAWNIATEGFP